MKNSLNIFLLALVLIVAQACGSESKKNEGVAAEAQAAAEKDAQVLKVSERKAKLEKERAERAELRKVEIERLASKTPTYTNAKGELVFYKSEIAPSFNGGDNAMMDFLRDNVKFPKEAEAKGLEGTVFVDFVITKKGLVREVEVTEETSKAVDQSFRDEAIRVVTSMPAWIPGKQQGKAVDVRFSIPITFEMN